MNTALIEDIWEQLTKPYPSLASVRRNHKAMFLEFDMQAYVNIPANEFYPFIVTYLLFVLEFEGVDILAEIEA